MILVYNINQGLMADLTSFAFNHIDDVRHDYFDESLLKTIDKHKFSIKETDFTTPLEYDSFSDLGRACWMLFGTAEQNVKKVGKKFEPLLKDELSQPALELKQRIIHIKKK